MSRINTNVPSLIGQINLGRSQSDLQLALNRLSTGLRINNGKDDPAGLIAVESIASDRAGIQKAISNTQQANEVIATGDSALGQISRLLNDIRGLVTEAANTGALSDDQIDANQKQVDASLEAIDRIAAITSFQGRKLLDGSLGFITSSVNTSQIAALEIQQASWSGSSFAVTVTVSTAASKATIAGITSAGTLASQSVVEISGTRGAEVFTFGTGTTGAQITNAINLVADAIGVDAVSSGTNLAFNAREYGSDAFVEIKQVTGSGFTGAGSRATGADVAGHINGAAFAARGLNISLNTSTLDVVASLAPAFGTTTGTSSFAITGGGALFQMGPDIVSNQQARVGIDSVNVAQLATAINGTVRRMYELKSGQAADLDTDATAAFQIVDNIINKITTLRGRLGAFQRTTLDSNLVSLNDTLTNLTEAESYIRDADFAVETSRLTRAQILVQSGTSVLQIANQNPRNVLSLLQQ